MCILFPIMHIAGIELAENCQTAFDLRNADDCFPGTRILSSPSSARSYILSPPPNIPLRRKKTLESIRTNEDYFKILIYRIGVRERMKLSKFISLCILRCNERTFQWNKTLISRVKSAREKIKNFSIEIYPGNKGNRVIEITFCFIPIAKSSVEM